ncbi:sugar ABC transporter substrate-binding protein [Acidimangrovimonas sediminis]|uniref:sugar ABC transporter substrate-binding protein n=1 Tax=Acidimangrovimonas sediminis TaxID=2056283 RepID=UPI000C81027E|nr:sugar ABC transporter substrate-binding protein [Acidimangrovimonas sediminis]
MDNRLKALIAGSTAMAAVALAGGASADQMKIGITQNNVGVDSYQTTYEKAFIAAAKANPNVDVVVLDAGGDVARQIAQIQDLIQQKVQAIIIWPTNGKAVVPAVKKAHDAGIPVVITNSNIAKQGMPFISAFSGPNNIEQGKEAADMMCKALNDKGQIVQISGKPGYTTAIEREKGFEDQLSAKCPGVKILDTQPGDWNREKSQRVMEDFLVKYPKIDGVYAADDNMGVGALNAAKAAGRAKDIKFVGATNFAVGYEAMKKGEYYGSVYQSPVDDAENALKTAIEVIEGKKVPKMNYFKTPEITQANMDKFKKPVF